jgi:hypothetical protein
MNKRPYPAESVMLSISQSAARAALTHFASRWFHISLVRSVADEHGSWKRKA